MQFRYEVTEVTKVTVTRNIPPIEMMIFQNMGEKKTEKHIGVYLPCDRYFCDFRSPSIEPPTGARRFPRYTFAEVKALNGMTNDQIRQADRVRSIFRGEAVRHDRNGKEEAQR